KPKPAAKPAAQQTAAATPQAAAGPVKYVVQVGSKKNQTEALASFADMQQKYPTLLANYRPIVQKADLGTKGTWYRLRIGPITEKSAASKLCSQLKSQGLADCLVMDQETASFGGTCRPSPRAAARVTPPRGPQSLHLRLCGLGARRCPAGLLCRDPPFRPVSLSRPWRDPAPNP